MRRPRPLTGAALAAFTVATAVTGFAGTPSAFADSGAANTLYVQHDLAACSDSGAGTEAAPFCTIQAAANVVLPGQTVRIIPASVYGQPYTEAVTLTRSGTPSAPITFSGAPVASGGAQADVKSPSGSATFTLSGVHDVDVASLTLEHDGGAGVAVSGANGVTLDRLSVNGPLTDPVSDDVDIDGASSAVTVSRSELNGSSDAGVRVASGASHVVVTTNTVRSAATGGVVADGVADLDVTSNGFSDQCSSDVRLTGGTSGSVENNQFSQTSGHASDTCAAPGDPELSVSADSAGGVTSDYNAFSPNVLDTRPEDSWAGTSYTTAGAFSAATGQGAHDIITGYQPAGSTVVDSADADAPGELDTDINGVPHVDDHQFANTGAGHVTYADRGDTEAHDLITIPVTEAASPANGVVPFTTSVPVGDATSGWGEDLTYSVDFGDGSAPVTGTADDPPLHTYTTPGPYTETVTVTDADGVTQTRDTPVVAATPTTPGTSLAGGLDPAPGSNPATAGVARFSYPVPDDWEIASRTMSFGDGLSGDVPSDGVSGHPYDLPGVYPVKLTVTDVLGRTATASTTFTSTDAFESVSGEVVQQTIPAHGVGTMSGAHLGSGRYHAYVVRVNATGATAGGWLTAYPAGSARPSASTLNFPAGQNASNEETVVPGANRAVSIYNGAASPVTVSVQTVGVVESQVADQTYHPTSPTTLLDTRYGTGGVTGPVGAGKSVTVQVAGENGVPADATAAVLDVAENTTKAAGSLTVAPDSRPDRGVTASYWNTGQSVTNLVTVPLIDGKVTLTNTSTGTANLLTALAGWYSADATGSGAWSVTPVRVLNTQTGLGETGAKPLKLAAHGTLKVKVAGTAGLPATDLTAADLNLTVSAPTASGWLVAYPDGTTLPTAGCLNYTAGHTIAGRALIKVGADGYLDLYNPTSTAIDVFADIHGAYVATHMAD